MTTEGGAKGVREWLHTEVFAGDLSSGATTAAAVDAWAGLLERERWDTKGHVANTRLDLFVEHSGLPFEVAALIRCAAMTDAERAAGAVYNRGDDQDLLPPVRDETPDIASAGRIDPAREAEKRRQRRMLEEGCGAWKPRT
jgi:hypothetical protein